MATNSNSIISLSSNSGILSLEVISVDIDPSGNKWFNLKAKVESGGFSGWSKFWLAPGQMKEFLISLDEFDRTINGNPKLICGQDEQEFFRLEFVTYDRLGNIGVKVDLVSLDVNRSGTAHRVGVEMGIELHAVSDFRKNLEALAQS